MREKELVLYRNFENGKVLHDMAWLMEHYNSEFYNREDMASLCYESISALLDMAASHGFFWQYLALLFGRFDGKQ